MEEAVHVVMRVNKTNSIRQPERKLARWSYNHVLTTEHLPVRESLLTAASLALVLVWQSGNLEHLALSLDPVQISKVSSFQEENKCAVGIRTNLLISCSLIHCSPYTDSIQFSKSQFGYTCMHTYYSQSDTTVSCLWTRLPPSEESRSSWTSGVC